MQKISSCHELNFNAMHGEVLKRKGILARKHRLVSSNPSIYNVDPVVASSSEHASSETETNVIKRSSC